MTNACNLRIAARHAVFGTPEARLGLLPGGGSISRLPRQIPYAKAMEMLLLGEAYTAREALEIENEVSALVMASKDAREGPRAFKEKRKPQFVGE